MFPVSNSLGGGVGEAGVKERGFTGLLLPSCVGSLPSGAGHELMKKSSGELLAVQSGFALLCLL